MSKMEFRFKPVDLDFEQQEDRMIVSGYVNLTGEFSDILSTGHSRHEFIEKIESGAFARALDRADDDIDFLAEHDSSLILSSTRNNSLSLKEDDKGLYMVAIISPTTWGKDYYTLIQDGILQNFSFGFVALEDRWDERSDGMLIRTIEELDLFEVSVVKNPAYPQSNIQARSLDVVTELDLNNKVKEVKRMKKQEKKELEIREDQVDDEAEDIDEEDSILALEKTVLALDLKIEKLYNMVEEFLTDIMREDEPESEEETEEVVEEEETEEEVEEEPKTKKEEGAEARSKDANSEIFEKKMAELRLRIKDLK